MIDYLKNLEDSIKTELIANEVEIGKILDEHKIIVTIIKDLVLKNIKLNVKQIKISIPQVRKQRLTTQDVEILKQAKKILKHKTDMMYLFTLLVRIKEEVSKVNLKNVSIEGRSLFKEALEETVIKLQEVDVKLLK